MSTTADYHHQILNVLNGNVAIFAIFETLVCDNTGKDHYQENII